MVFHKAASTKKLLYKSHSSLNSEWWAVLALKQVRERKASPTFSKKSVIHAVVNVFCCVCVCVFFPLLVFLPHLQPMLIVLKHSCVSNNWSLLSFAYQLIPDLLSYCYRQGKALFNRACPVLFYIIPNVLKSYLHCEYIKYLKHEAF